MNAQMIKRPMLGAFVMAILILTNCSPEDSNSDIVRPVMPSQEVLYAFSVKYPDAGAILWDMENEFYVARFVRMSIPVNAWFGKEGEWLLSEEEYPFNRIRSGVLKTFYLSSYADWSIERTHLLDRKDMDTVYVISATRDNRFVRLHYSKFGDFIKAKSGTNDYAVSPVVIPPEINRALYRLFDTPRMIDLWKDELAVNVAIREGDIYYLVVFTFDYEWICTFRDILQTDLKAGIWEKFQSSEYGAYTVNQFRIMQNKTDLLYVFYFTDNEKKSHILFIKENGNFDCVISY